MPSKKSLKKAKIIKPSRVKEQANELADPSLVNGIRDEAAADALNVGPLTRTTKKARASAKAKKPNKVVHPKAKITFRRNFLPAILGILMMLGVLGLLNGQWLVAQYQYRFTKPPSAASFSENAANVDPNSPAHIYIPKINVSAPIVTDVKTYDAGAVHSALERGVLQYGSASADPGQKGNAVVVGHSSGQLWAPGDFKFVFTLLDKLTDGDRVLVDFKGKRYIYRVNSEKIVPPTDLSVLQQSDEPQLTLITCTPVGTSKNRLVITARQVSPRPETATAITTDVNKNASSDITIPN